MNDFAALERRIVRVEDALINKGKERPGWLTILEKLFVPISLGILAYVGSCASDKIASAQVRLAESQEERQRQEALAERQLKYLELFYKDISAPEVRRQHAALSLLSVVDADVGAQLARAVAYNPAMSREIRQRAQILGREIERFGPLINYKVVIYFPSSSTSAAGTANHLRSRLIDTGFRGEVVSSGKDQGFFQNVRYPAGYEIRYDNIYESDAADYLAKLLKEVAPQLTFQKVIAGRRRTENMISIFIPASAPNPGAAPDG